jgi:HEAT repeat protein
MSAPVIDTPRNGPAKTGTFPHRLVALLTGVLVVGSLLLIRVLAAQSTNGALPPIEAEASSLPVLDQPAEPVSAPRSEIPQTETALPAVPEALGKPGAPAGSRIAWMRDDPPQREPVAEVAVERLPVPPQKEEDLRPRLAQRGENELIPELMGTAQVGLRSSDRYGIYKAYKTAASRNSKVTGSAQMADPTPLLQIRPDFNYLPLRQGPTAQLAPRDAGTLAVLSRKMHAYFNTISPVGPSGERTNPAGLAAALNNDLRGKKPEWLRVEAVPTLNQMLMTEDRPFRSMLVQLLAEIPERPATLALVQRVLFDLSPEVRERAVQALAGRNPLDYRPGLLSALRYPWAPAAEHAARALVTLKDKESVPSLVTLLPLPDPAEPQRYRNQLVMQQLVRMNHNNSCLVCHPPALLGTEPVVGFDPVPRQGNPAPGAGSGMRGGRCASGSMGGSRSPGSLPTTNWVRADIAFLKQDFSTALPVRQVLVPAVAPPGGKVNPPQPGIVQQLERFDFVVRRRLLTPTEKRLWEKNGPARKDYPQREAILYALRELTGEDLGRETVAWQERFPRAAREVEAGRLARTFLKSNPLQQQFLLDRYRDSPGELNTLTLARIATDAQEPLQGRVRAALVERLSKRSAFTRRNALDEGNPELCRAAILACVKVGEKHRVTDLLALTEGPDPQLAERASEAARQLTGSVAREPSEQDGSR